MAVNPIQLSEIVVYWRDVRGVVGSALQDKVQLIMRMDMAFLHEASKKDNT